MKKKFKISKKLYLLAFMLISSSPAMATTSNMPWVSMFDKFVGVILGATLIFGAISWAPQWFGYSGAVLI